MLYGVRITYSFSMVYMGNINVNIIVNVVL